MPKTGNRGITAKNVIALALAILILFGLVAGIWILLKYTNGGTEDFKTFTIEVDGEPVVASKTAWDFRPGTHEVKITYLFDWITGEEKEWSVKMQPKPGASYDYTVDGSVYPWSDAKEIEKAFSLKKEADGFTFTVPGDHKEVLAALYPGQTVSAPAKDELKDLCLYELVVSSYDGGTVYTIDFAIRRAVEGVDANPKGIIF